MNRPSVAARRSFRRRRFLLAAAALLALAGCSSPNTQFYILSEVPPAHALPSSTGIVIGVGRLTIPESLDRPQVVRRESASKLNVDDFSRWGGPLGDAVSRVLTADLRLRLGPERVVLLTADPVVKPAYTLETQFDRFDVDMAGHLTLQANWSINLGTDSRSVMMARTSLIGLDGAPGIDGSVTSMSAGLGQLADEIAAAAATLPRRVAAPARPAPASLTPGSLTSASPAPANPAP